MKRSEVFDKVYLYTIKTALQDNAMLHQDDADTEVILREALAIATSAEQVALARLFTNTKHPPSMPLLAGGKFPGGEWNVWGSMSWDGEFWHIFHSPKYETVSPCERLALTERLQVAFPGQEATKDVDLCKICLEDMARVSQENKQS